MANRLKWMNIAQMVIYLCIDVRRSRVILGSNEDSESHDEKETVEEGRCHLREVEEVMMISSLNS